MIVLFWGMFLTSPSFPNPSTIVENVAYDPTILYSTLVIAILITKGYGRTMAIKLTRILLHSPTKRLWASLRGIKPRQIVYFGLRWGIPVHQLRQLVSLHRNILHKWRPRSQRRNTHKSSKKCTIKTRHLNTTVSLYRRMPFKTMSRAWGKFNELDLPVFLRKPLLGLYIWMFGVKLHEAEDEELKNYRNLSEFFRRKLKSNVRLVDQSSALTCPSDGRILHFGKVEKGVVEQVKGVNYELKGFLGSPTWSGDCQEVDENDNVDSSFHDNLRIRPGNALYHCIIYLAPGDYHRFHSAADWQVTYRRHFPGELLSVNPGVARWIRGLFSFNERVVYCGSWQYGFFSYTAVGATNVGSIKIYIDQDLQTNTTSKKYPDGEHFDKRLDDEHNKGIAVKKGEMFGEFNLGSTIVLVFEAPENFQFTVRGGQKVQFGQSLGKC